MTAYIIVSGEYSDWYIEGITLDGDKAKRYVEYKNAEECQDHYYIIERELDTFECDFSEELAYEHAFYFKDCKIDKTNIFKCLASKKNEIEDVRWLGGYDFVCHVILREENVDKARKIAKDMIFKRMAEKLDL